MHFIVVCIRDQSFLKKTNSDFCRTWCRFEQYVDYALDVPMYFVYRKKKYIDCSGMSFRVSIYPCYRIPPFLSSINQGLLPVLPSFNCVTWLQDFLVGKLPCIPGELPTLNDWENHLTTIFPEVTISSPITCFNFLFPEYQIVKHPLLIILFRSGWRDI